MDRTPTIVRANIKRYGLLLEGSAVDPATRETLKKLLAEETAKLPRVKGD
jgi:hypothetical protein